MKLIDSHCHLNFSSFTRDYRDIIADCLAQDIGVINIGSQFDSSQCAVEIANEYKNDPIYASIGMHPIHLSKTEFDPEEISFMTPERKFEPEKYQALINDKVVAMGEIGLDYWHIPQGRSLDEIKKTQKRGFVQQIKFAQENNLPIIFHARGSKDKPEDAYLDILEILKTQIIRLPDYQTTGVIHCFGSTKAIAQQFLDLGFYIGFTGVITFKNKSADPLREVVQHVPLDKILVETDAPYLTPEPHRGEKNKPQYVEFVARKVAEIKNVSYEKVCEETTQNVKKLFALQN